MSPEQHDQLKAELDRIQAELDMLKFWVSLSTIMLAICTGILLRMMEHQH